MLERIELGEVDYEAALALQEHHRARVDDGAQDVLLLLSHPPTVTLGLHGKPENIVSAGWLESQGVRVVRTDRGGDVTWHGPGQLVGYPIVSLARRGLGVRRFVEALAEALQAVLAARGVASWWEPAAPGLWTAQGKLAAFGVRVRGGVTTHGFALNVSCDLQGFQAIVPCGLARPVTSLQALGASTAPLEEPVHQAVEAALFRLAARME